MRHELVAGRERAQAQVAALTRSFDDIVEATTLVSTDDEHDPDGATIAFERAQVAALLQQARHDVDAIDRALAHVDDPGYGTCQGCGRAIVVERLLALPSARTCVTCAAQGA